jgi:hypothetical protein
MHVPGGCLCIFAHLLSALLSIQPELSNAHSTACENLNACCD